MTRYVSRCLKERVYAGDWCRKVTSALIIRVSDVRYDVVKDDLLMLTQVADCSGKMGGEADRRASRSCI